MKKNTKWILIICAAFLLIAGWTWRYISLNAYWESTIPAEYTETVFSIGETVTFGKDIFLPEGFALRANNFTTVDYNDYLADNNISLESTPNNPPDKLALVEVTLSNACDIDKSINLSEFSLHGIDFLFSSNMELLAAANPILGGNIGVTLRPEESCDFVLVYELRDEYLSRHTWNNFDSYALYLTTTIYPARQEIKVQ